MGKPVFILVGLPSPVGEAVRKGLERDKNLKAAEYLEAKSIGDPYSLETAQALLLATVRHIENSEKTAGLPRQLIMLMTGSGNNQHFFDLFGNACFPIAIPLDPAHAHLIRAPGFMLDRFRSSVVSSYENRSLNDIQIAVRQQFRRSLFTLPPGNFHDPTDSGLLNAVFRQLLLGQAEWQAVTNRLRHRTYNSEQLPRVLSGEQRMQAFVDERDVIFCPSRPNEMHGRVWSRDSNANATLKNWINGHYRFGIPLPQGFHFDCQKERGSFLSVSFACCTNGSVSAAHARHANIYPNDFVRI